MIGDKKCWGNSYGFEAGYLILYHGFIDLGLERISSVWPTSNIRAIKHAEKLGYKEEGVLRHALFIKGKYQDLSVMSILKDEFIASSI